jgi:hypothetical protein
MYYKHNSSIYCTYQCTRHTEIYNKEHNIYFYSCLFSKQNLLFTQYNKILHKDNVSHFHPHFPKIRHISVQHLLYSFWAILKENSHILYTRINIRCHVQLKALCGCWKLKVLQKTKNHHRHLTEVPLIYRSVHFVCKGLLRLLPKPLNHSSPHIIMQCECTALWCQNVKIG